MRLPMQYWLIGMDEYMVRRSNCRHQKVDEDPMAGAANLVDAMLVIAVGFLIFIVISSNMPVINPDQSVQHQVHQKMSEVEKGQMIERIPESEQSSFGEGYEQLGKVYRDPSTGKLVLVEG